LGIGHIEKPLNFERYAGAVLERGTYWRLLNQPPQLAK